LTDDRFLIDAVHQLATKHGIRQFLDIGTGLPTADNTHDVAQRAAPESKIVYVDYDPVVLTHAQALLTSSPEGVTARPEASSCAGHGVAAPAGEAELGVPVLQIRVRAVADLRAAG
jgi:hypothetical protein